MDGTFGVELHYQIYLAHYFEEPECRKFMHTNN